MPKSVRCECKICGSEFFRCPSEVRRGKNKTCSKQCLGKLQTGKRNPFYGRSHDAKTRSRISKSRSGKCVGNQNAKGHKHSKEAIAKIAAASKRLWRDSPEKIRSKLPRGANHHAYSSNETYRRNANRFTDKQRERWTGTRCAMCKTTERLELDHIIPRFAGGLATKANSQTLCRFCNLWKFHHFDLKRFSRT